MDKYLGKKLDGRYEITELIGIGGMANVYKAYDVIENRVVAVKILREEYMGNEEMRRRFKNESKAMAVLNHSNVMRVYDVSFSDRMQSIVMEYIDGITLKEYIEQQGSLKWKEAVHFTVQTLRALQHAHDKGIVHRDIKPQNIMLLSDGTIKITDFGIARFARSETRTLTDKAIGSVHYISPEQAAGAATDARTDLYAVGVILYEMLTGRVPFEADTPVSVALKQIQSTAIPPRQINPSIPEGLQEITLHAMEKDITKRYQSAAQMLRDIDEFKRDPSISFEYKYLDVPSGREKSKYTDAIRSVRAEKDNKKMSKKKKKRRKPKRAPIIPVLAGVTTAFVIVTGAFILWMFMMNNPFTEVAQDYTPDLVGQKWNNVQVAPKYEKFIIEPDGDPEYNNEYGRGVIFDQTPKAGMNIKLNKKIKVKISRGPQSLLLPDYSGQDLTQVVAELSSQGIDTLQKGKFDDATPVNTIINTSPPSGTEVGAGEAVTLYYSMGKKETVVPVPDLKGVTPADAQTIIENLGLKIGTTTYDETVEDESLIGTIVGQSPAPPSQAPSGSAIDITVAGASNEMKRLRLDINLPSHIEEKVKLEAYQDGALIEQTDAVPYDMKVWNPVFEGYADNISEVSIYLNGELYQVLDLYFEKDGFVMKEDYSDDF
ncbi:MAG: Stk1 family PASTA domain-containing Ser/Thr kinase [Oscillospiraceae bacterium]|nr:Stk1 family PASTA domain-containing Ser/Thr kinase [Oscillospiraceae bacterium]RKJ57879.1 Stk1 family PASTA domain-containing Ser/Thr kinase [bacterium 1XD42-8]RKJ66678.1 Stk1 family PASTA domain-containing Ser/Thr kinase [bacterium 1XD42-1]